MSGRIKGPEYDSECRSLLHQYQLSSQAIINFQGLDYFIKVSANIFFISDRSLTCIIVKAQSEEYMKENLGIRVKTTIKDW